VRTHNYARKDAHAHAHVRDAGRKEAHLNFSREYANHSISKSAQGHHCHICTGTGLAAATSATGTESNKQPHLSYNAGNMQRTIRHAPSHARTTRDMTDGGFVAEGEYRTPCKTRRCAAAS
jgi:hypothetical protein